MRWIKRVTILGLIVLSLVAVAEASLPSGIENTIRGWFNSAGKLMRLTFAKTTAKTAKAGTCELFMDSATNTFKVSCNGNAPTSLIGTGTVSCTDDGAGNLTCNSFNSPDQDPTLPNVSRIYRNTVGRTCAANGVANTLSTLDTVASPNRWCTCDGTGQLFCFPSTGASTITDDTVLIGTGNDTGSYKDIPDCDDTGGRHLNYDTTTGTFTCGTS